MSTAAQRARQSKPASHSTDRVIAAARALLADVRRRYPGEELRCEYMRDLDDAIRMLPESGVVARCGTCKKERLLTFKQAETLAQKPPACETPRCSGTVGNTGVHW